MDNKENHKTSSSFAGFLDGYKARNIQSIERSLNYKIEEILELISSMNSFLKENPKNTELVNSLEKTSSFLKEKDVNVINRMYSFGEAFKSNIKILDTASEISAVNLKEKERKIIYNFSELAKMSEDRRLINLAIEIGEAFSF